ncbi:MAG TPA: hypothetical protein VGE52_04690, partial [Pirellulales bacterium]
MRAVVRGLACCLLICLALDREAAAQSLRWSLERGDPVPRIPTPAYFLAVSAARSGDYLAAMGQFEREIRGAPSIAANTPWIDSLAYRARYAETAFATGAIRDAFDANTAAVQIATANARWFQRAKTPETISPVHPGLRRDCPWGVSSRKTLPGAFPPNLAVGPIRFFGQRNMNAFGGYYTLTASEMLQNTALALRRRREWLGPSATEDVVLFAALEALKRHVSSPFDWTRVWSDVLVGLAHSAVGQKNEATAALVRGCTINGELDHCLTGAALCELGRLELVRGAFNAASVLYHDASVAAFHFGDVETIEESLRGGWIAHRMANTPGPFVPLGFAIEWAQAEKLTALAASLLVLQAESALAANDLKAALACLEEVERLSLRTDLATSRVAAEAKRVAAIIAFRQGQAGTGQAALAESLQFMERGSVWRLQVAYIDKLALAGSLSPRQVAQFYSGVLRDPTPADWQSSPLESLSYLAAAGGSAHARWFDSLAFRNDDEHALEVSELTRRERFFDTLPLGGRLTGLRWTLHHPDAIPPAKVQAERTEIVGRTAGYSDAERQIAALEKRIAALPALPRPGDDVAVRNALVGTWTAATEVRESLLWGAAIDRTPCSLAWPPLRTVKELKAKLGPRQAILAFLVGAHEVRGFLIEPNLFTSWVVGPTAEINALAAKFVADLGVNPLGEGLDEKAWRSPVWKESSRALWERLTLGIARNDFPEGIDELTIVPDGALWYVPFEALAADPAVDLMQASVPTLGQRVRIRYAPMVGLAVADSAPRAILGPTVVLTGKPTVRDVPETAERLAVELAQINPNTIALAPAQRPRSPGATLGWGR